MEGENVEVEKKGEEEEESDKMETVVEENSDSVVDDDDSEKSVIERPNFWTHKRKTAVMFADDGEIPDSIILKRTEMLQEILARLTMEMKTRVDTFHKFCMIEPDTEKLFLNISKAK